MGWLSRWVLWILIVTGCAETAPVVKQEPEPERTGSALILDLNPTGRPDIAGRFGFELIEGVGVGKACVDRASTTEYWLGWSDLTKLKVDWLTRQAIAAAAFDALSRLEDADTIVVTRVLVEGKGSPRVCASVYGRALKLTKAAE